MMNTASASLQFSDIRQYRQSLLPFWIKFIGWCFIVFGILTAVASFASLLQGGDIHIAVFGFFYDGSPYAFVPISLVVLVCLNGVCAYSLLFSKNWAIDASLYVAYITLIVTVIGKLNFEINYLHFEFLLILPYLYTLHKIKRSWVRPDYS